MPFDTRTLILLFPIAFMAHDFEELVFGEAWLKQNAATIKARLQSRAPRRVTAAIGAALDKTTPELAFSIGLIFAVICMVTFLALGFEVYGAFILAAGLFFVHGFVHIAQALLLRKYVPAVISSALVVIPYGWALFARLLADGSVTALWLWVYFPVAALLAAPVILVMHKAGELLYPFCLRILIQRQGA